MSDDGASDAVVPPEIRAVLEELFPLEGVSHLGEGASNQVFLVDSGVGKHVCKLTRPGCVRRLPYEAGILSRLAPGIGPALVAIRTMEDHLSADLLLQEHVGGVHMHTLDVRHARLLGERLRVLHSQPATVFEDVAERLDWRDYLASRIHGQLDLCRSIAPEPLVEAFVGIIDRIAALGGNLSDDLGGRTRSLIHGDLIPLNVLFTDDKGCLIDWELARLDHSEWDLASVAKAFRFADDAQDAFWEAYGSVRNPDILGFVSLLQYCNVALWRACSYYVRGENRHIATKFLAELDDELLWLHANMPEPHRASASASTCEWLMGA